MLEYQRDLKTDAKHTVEEAMTAALLRKCNNCQKPFLKEDGCNMIYCACGNKQCDICSKNVQGYDHFDRTQKGTGKQKCPLFDDAAKRSKEEVAAAQVEAITRVLQKQIDLTAEEVTVDKDLSDVRPPAAGVLAIAAAGRQRHRDGLNFDYQWLRHQEMDQVIQQEEERQARERERQLLIERTVARAAVERELIQERKRAEHQARQAMEEQRRRIQERLEQERLEREQLEAERREEQEALEAVRIFEEQEERTRQREMEMVIEKTHQEDRWSDFLKQSSILATVSAPHPQDLQVFEIDGYWAQKQQELNTYISYAKGYELEQTSRSQQGLISVMNTNKFRRINALINLAVQSSQRLTQEAEARRRSSSIRAAQLQKEKEEALKQRTKARQMEKKTIKGTGVKAEGKFKSLLKKTEALTTKR
jgi:hypothetical protein